MMTERPYPVSRSLPWLGFVLVGAAACADASSSHQASAAADADLASSVSSTTRRIISSTSTPVPAAGSVGASAAPLPEPSPKQPPSDVDSMPSAPLSLFEIEAIRPPHDAFDGMNEGRRLMFEGKPGEAVTAFRQALYHDPSAGTWFNLGEAYRVSGDLDHAIPCLEEGLRKDPHANEARRSLVRVYLAEQRGDAAKPHAEQLIRRADAAASDHYLAGRTFMRLSMWREAMQAFERVVEQEPNAAWARNNLGFSALMIGENEQALTHLEALLALPPMTPVMFNNLGVAYERVGRPADALASFLRAVELEPNYINAAVNRERLRRSLTADEQELAQEILFDLREPPTPSTTMASIDQNPSDLTASEPAE